MLGSLIATVEGGVDLVTGVWGGDQTKDDYGKTAGVDVRHCKGGLNLRGLGFEFGRELSTVKKHLTPFIIHLSHERQTEHEI